MLPKYVRLVICLAALGGKYESLQDKLATLSGD